MSNGYGILLLSDDEAAQKAVRVALENDKHYSLIISTNPDDANVHLESGEVHAIIFDAALRDHVTDNPLMSARISYPYVARLLIGRDQEEEVCVSLASHASAFMAIMLPSPSSFIKLTIERALEMAEISRLYRTTSRELKISVDEDISKRKAAENALRESEEQLRAVVETAVDGVIIINDRAEIAAFNPACERLFGYTACDVVGQNVKMLMPEPYQAEHDGYMQNYAETGERKIIGIGREVLGLRKDGSTFPMELSVGEAHQEGVPVYVGIIRDITERKTAERAIERSVNELASFAYSVAHDLKAPLRAVSGFATALDEDYRGKLDEDADTYINFITENAQRMAGMIDDLLEYSRLGRDDIPFAMISPLDVIKGLEKSLVAVIHESNAKIEIGGDWDEIEAHASTLSHVFQNLMTNGIKFAKPDTQPEVVITGKVLSNGMQITFTDNGIGIPDDCHDKVFKIFHRLNTTDNYQGTGIGLAVVRKGVDFHHGTITLESALDAGTTFTIVLPKYQRD